MEPELQLIESKEKQPATREALVSVIKKVIKDHDIKESELYDYSAHDFIKARVAAENYIKRLQELK